MRWLIAEDSLINRRGHWFEYLGAYHRELQELGDQVQFLVSKPAEPFILETFKAQPVLPDAIFHRMGDGSNALKRYSRVPLHAWKTWRAIQRWLKTNPAPDLIFVPTVIVHHLWGWQRVVKKALRHLPNTRLLLFFPGAPVQVDAQGGVHWDQAPTAKLTQRLINSLRPEVERGQVILGAETHPMVRELTRLSGVRFTYLPHPVSFSSDATECPELGPEDDIILGSYGGARHEKGTDILVSAVEQHLQTHPETRLRFVLQMADSFTDAWKRLVDHPRVEIVEGYFPPGEYPRQLARTHGLILPYRASSYALRVSRVVIEAMAGGFPLIATDETTLSDQAREFGAGVYCKNEDVGSLAKALRELELHFGDLRYQAWNRRGLAREHFSIATFRDILAHAHGNDCGSQTTISP